MTLLDHLPSLEHATPEIADEFGIRAHAGDESDFRHRARRYRKALRGVGLVYAGKSPLTPAVARWAREEGLGIEVCSGDELATALAGGTDPARIVMQGNATSPDELRDAVRAGVGRIVLDSRMEIAYLAGLARRRQPVLIRVTLAGDHTADAVKRVLSHPILDLVGLHCQLSFQGYQVSAPALDGEAIHRLIAAMADIRTRHGVILTELNLGGGHAAPHIPGEPDLDAHELARVIEDALDDACAREHFPRPRVVV